MDMNLFVSRKEAKQVVQDAWRQFRTTDPSDHYVYSVAIETVQLAHGQAADFGIDADEVEVWQMEIDQEINHYGNQ